MEPISALTAGAIAFLTAVGVKIGEKSQEQLAGFVVERAPKLLELFKRKRPELAAKLESAEPQQQQVLVAEIVEAANRDAEIKQELEALGKAAQNNPQVFQQAKVGGGTALIGGTHYYRTQTNLSGSQHLETASQRALQKLKDTMQRMSDEAQAKGLTPEILQEILAGED
ncbi:MAG: hypothetical protein HC890_12215 [Chloroflexaceae bacterium]|nr:hypothetical protein [Chloroflexaceae bacterium]